MNMVGHQAISDERYSVEVHVLVQELKVNRSIGVAVQDEAPVVPTLGQVVWHINGNYPSESSHSKETISANHVYLAASRKDELQLILDRPIGYAGSTQSAGLRDLEKWKNEREGVIRRR